MYIQICIVKYREVPARLLHFTETQRRPCMRCMYICWKMSCVNELLIAAVSLCTSSEVICRSTTPRKAWKDMKSVQAMYTVVVRCSRLQVWMGSEENYRSCAPSRQTIGLGVSFLCIEQSLAHPFHISEKRHEFNKQRIKLRTCFWTSGIATGRGAEAWHVILKAEEPLTLTLYVLLCIWMCIMSRIEMTMRIRPINHNQSHSA